MNSRRWIILAVMLAGFTGVLPAAETVYRPAPLGARGWDPLIPAPGMGWVAYTWTPEIRYGGQWLEGVLQSLKSPAGNWYLEDSAEGNCRLLYVRLRWQEFEEIKETSLLEFLETVQALNAAEPDVWKRFHVFLAVEFTDTCQHGVAGYPDGWGIDDFPPYIEDPCGCTGCPVAADILDTYLLDFCLDPQDWVLCLNQTSDPPYHVRYQLRELNYFNPDVLPDVVAPWNQELADYVARFDCIAGLHPAFLGNWGQNHLAMFTAYGTADPPRDWESFRANVAAWFEDFAGRMYALPRGVDLFFSENYHWQYTDFLCHADGRLAPGQSAVEDMFQMAWDIGATLHWGSTGISHLPDPAYDLAFREAIRAGAPYFSEWDANESLEDEFTFHPNYMQLNMCGSLSPVHLGCWSLQDAVRSYGVAAYQQSRNRLGYRFQVGEIRRDANPAGGWVEMDIRNIGDGFCINPVRLTLRAVRAVGETVVDTVEIDPVDIRHLRADDLEALTVRFSLPPRSQWPGGTAEVEWQVRLEVFDYWTGQYLPVGWSNWAEGVASDRISVLPVMGDVDGNLRVQPADTGKLGAWLVEGYSPVSLDPAVADYNGDGRIDLRDLVIMRRTVH